jgi:hypothetical protein
VCLKTQNFNFPSIGGDMLFLPSKLPTGKGRRLRPFD